MLLRPPLLHIHEYKLHHGPLCCHHPQEPVGKESPPVLADFSEGLIGKLQIRKSGKVQLVLGDNKLDVSEGAAFSFLQVLTVLSVKPTRLSANIKIFDLASNI